MKMAVFLGVVLYSLVDTDHVSELLTASIIALMMEAVSTSATLVNIYQTTECNIPEYSHLLNMNIFQ
jgi:hypothetical protein